MPTVKNTVQIKIQLNLSSAIFAPLIAGGYDLMSSLI